VIDEAAFVAADQAVDHDRVGQVEKRVVSDRVVEALAT
jgi:hypothetical protein